VTARGAMPEAMILHFSHGQSFLESLAAGYNAAILREAGHATEIVCLTSQTPLADVGAQVRRVQPRVVLASLHEMDDVDPTLRLLSVVREAAPRALVILGGRGASLGYDSPGLQAALRDSVIHNLVVGEGERLVQEVADLLGSGGELMWPYARGTTIRPALVDDLDSLPFPARDALSASLRSVERPEARILGARGCVAHCTFCSSVPWDDLNGSPRLRFRSVHNIVDEMCSVVETTRVTHFEFVDDLFLLRGQIARDRASSLRDLLRGAGAQVTFRVQARASKIDPIVVELLLEAGLTEIWLGVESFDPATLEIYRKGVSAEEIEQSLALLTSAGFSTDVLQHPQLVFGMLTFHAEATYESFVAQLEGARRWGLHASRLGDDCSRVVPIHGSPLRRRYERLGLLGPDPDAANFVYRDPRAARFSTIWMESAAPLVAATEDLIPAIRMNPSDSTLQQRLQRLDEEGFQDFAARLDEAFT
jgi:hypothetical protein